MLSETNKCPLVLYHGPYCRDGFTCAWIANRFFTSIGVTPELYPINYEQEPPDVTGRGVFILDFSFKRPVMEKICRDAAAVVCLDHHESARIELAGCLPNAIVKFDMAKAGCRLTWEHFYPDTPVSWLVDYVEDRDLWNWQLPDSEAINAFFGSIDLTLPMWESLHKSGHGVEIVRAGNGILLFKNNTIKSLVGMAIEITLAGHAILAVNTPIFVSEVANILAQDRPFGACWHVSKDVRKQWRLRSTEGGLDVSKIAVEYGGGGHKRAAHFSARSLSTAQVGIAP